MYFVLCAALRRNKRNNKNTHWQSSVKYQSLSLSSYRLHFTGFHFCSHSMHVSLIAIHQKRVEWDDCRTWLQKGYVMALSVTPNASQCTQTYWHRPCNADTKTGDTHTHQYRPGRTFQRAWRSADVQCRWLCGRRAPTTWAARRTGNTTHCPDHCATHTHTHTAAGWSTVVSMHVKLKYRQPEVDS